MAPSRDDKPSPIKFYAGEKEPFLPKVFNFEFQHGDKVGGEALCHIVCIMTGAIVADTHHCSEGGDHTLTNRCFDKGHMNWCLVPNDDRLPCGQLAIGLKNNVCGGCKHKTDRIEELKALLKMGYTTLPYPLVEVEPEPAADAIEAGNKQEEAKEIIDEEPWKTYQVKHTKRPPPISLKAVTALLKKQTKLEEQVKANKKMGKSRFFKGFRRWKGYFGITTG